MDVYWNVDKRFSKFALSACNVIFKELFYNYIIDKKYIKIKKEKNVYVKSL